MPGCLQAAVPEDEWKLLSKLFTKVFQTYQAGEIDMRTAKHEVGDLLADEAPTMIEECFELFDLCCGTRAWSTPAFRPPTCAPLSIKLLNGLLSLTHT